MLAGMVAKPRAYLGTVLQDDAHSLTIISGSGEWARLAGGDCGLDLFKHDKAEADNQLRAFRAGHWLAQTCQFPPWLFCLFVWLFLFFAFLYSSGAVAAG